MQDLGDEGECYSNAQQSYETRPADKSPAEEINQDLIRKDAAWPSSDEIKDGVLTSPLPAKIPDSFVNEELIEESFRESYVEQRTASDLAEPLPVIPVNSDETALTSIAQQ